MTDDLAVLIAIIRRQQTCTPWQLISDFTYIVRVEQEGMKTADFDDVADEVRPIRNTDKYGKRGR